MLILLLVLAADSTVTALIMERRYSLLLTGVWVGLAFQAKMIEAWLVIPVLAITYLVASSTGVWSRMLRLTGMVVVAAAVSLSWMVFVTLTPSAERPYVDGSQHNSVFEQVFDYNGFGRVGQPSPNVQLGRTLHIPVLEAPPLPPAWNRLLIAPYGLDTGWLIPPALVVVVAGLLGRRRRPRTDLVRAGIVLWGTWLLAFGALLGASPSINSYYLAVLSPALAGLIGIGGSLAWVDRRAFATQMALLSAVLLSSAYAYWLLPSSGTGLPGWLAPTVLGLGIAAGVLIVVALSLRLGAAGTVLGLTLAGAAIIVVPAVATASVVANTLGAFDTPFQPTAVTAFTRNFLRSTAEIGLRAAPNRSSEERRVRPHGHPDFGAGGAVRLRHRPGGATDRWLHRHGPFAHGGRHLEDGGLGPIPPGTGCTCEHRSSDHMDRHPLPAGPSSEGSRLRCRGPTQCLLLPRAPPSVVVFERYCHRRRERAGALVPSSLPLVSRAPCRWRLFLPPTGTIGRRGKGGVEVTDVTHQHEYNTRVDRCSHLRAEGR